MKYLFSIIIFLGLCMSAFAQGHGPGYNPYFDYGRFNTYPSIQPYILQRPDGTLTRSYRYKQNYNAYRYYNAPPRYYYRYNYPGRVYLYGQGPRGRSFMFDYMY